MVKIPHGQQSRKFSRIAHPAHQPKQREAARAVNLLLMKDESWLHSEQLQQELGNTKIVSAVSLAFQPRQTSWRVSILSSPGSTLFTLSLQSQSQPGSRAGKGSFAQCLPAAPPCPAELLLPRREKSSDPLRAAQWSIHTPERTIQLSNHGISEIVLGSLHF